VLSPILCERLVFYSLIPKYVCYVKIHLILACITNFECNCYAHSLYYKIINKRELGVPQIENAENAKNRFEPHVAKHHSNRLISTFNFLLSLRDVRKNTKTHEDHFFCNLH
jgi:hypothetical protein